MVKRYLSIGLVICLCVTICIGFQICEAEEDDFKLGLQAYRDGTYDVAKKHFQNSITKNPDTEKAYESSYWLGWCHVKLETNAEAMASFNVALSSQRYGHQARFLLNWTRRAIYPDVQDSLEAIYQDLKNIPGSQLPLKLRANVALLKLLVNLDIGILAFRDENRSLAKEKLTLIVESDMKGLDRKSEIIVYYMKSIAYLWLGEVTHSQGVRNREKKKEYYSQAVQHFEHLERDIEEIDDLKQHRDQLLYYAALSHLFAGIMESNFSHLDKAEHLIDGIEPYSNIGIEDLKLLKATILFLKKDYESCLDTLSSFRDNDNLEQYWKGWVFKLLGKFEWSKSEFQSFKRNYQNTKKIWLKHLKADAAFRELENSHILARGEDDYATKQIFFDILGLQSRYGLGDYVDKLKLIHDVQLYYRDRLQGNERLGQELFKVGVIMGYSAKIDSGKSLFQRDNTLFYAITRTMGSKTNYPEAERVLRSLIRDEDIPRDEIDYALARVYEVNARVDSSKIELARDLYQELVRKGNLDACYNLGTLHQNAGEIESACEFFQKVIRSNRLTYYRREAEAKFFPSSLCGNVRLETEPVGPDMTEKIDDKSNMFQYDLMVQKGSALDSYFPDAVEMLLAHHKFFAVPDFYSLADPGWLGSPMAKLTVHIFAETDQFPILRLNGQNKRLERVYSQRYQYKYESGETEPGDYQLEVNARGFFRWSQDEYYFSEQTIPVQLDSAFIFDLNNPTGISPTDSCLHVHVDGQDVYELKPGNVIKNGISYDVREDVFLSAMTVLDGTLYLVAPEENKILQGILRSEGDNRIIVLEDFIGAPKEGDIAEYKGLTQPVEIAADRTVEGIYYVIDNGNRILKFDGNGQCLGKMATFGWGDSLDIPGSICIDSNGYLYVTDFGNRRVLKFHRDLKQVQFGDSKRTEIGGGSVRGEGDEDLFYPTSISVDGQGFIYVADLSGQILIFNRNGTFQRKYSIGERDHIVSQLEVSGKGVNKTKIYFIEREIKEESTEKERPRWRTISYQSKYDAQF